jgi:hypothetical protein
MRQSASVLALNERLTLGARRIYMPQAFGDVTKQHRRNRKLKWGTLILYILRHVFYATMTRMRTGPLSLRISPPPPDDEGTLSFHVVFIGMPFLEFCT